MGRGKRVSSGRLNAGNAFGAERSGLSGRRYGTEVRKSEPVALFGHPAETNLGPAKNAKNPYR